MTLARSAQPLYFGPDELRLFGWYHAPQGEVLRGAVLICQPLGYDMIVAYRAVRHLAEALAARGHSVMRFDYHGTGDSAGSDYEPGRVAAWIKSIDLAISELRLRSGAARVGIVGIRLGSLLGMHAASARDDVEAFVAWAPVLTGRARVREMRAFEQLMTGEDPLPNELPEGAVAAAGFVLTRDSVTDISSLEIKNLPRLPAARMMIIPRDDLPDDGRAAAALEVLGVQVTRAALPGYEGMMRDAHATTVPEKAIDGIAAWLAELSPAVNSALAAPESIVLRHVCSDAQLMGVSLPGVLAAIEERPFTADHGRLFGILSQPVGAVRAGCPAVILVNAGAVHRIGSNRMYVAFARAWAERGFRVLRLDIGGLGDSPPSSGMQENDTYSTRAVPDVGAAAEALRTAFGVERIVVGGLCSGAHTAFHAGLELTDVAGLVMLNPIVFYWKPTDALDVSAWMTYQLVHRYGQNVRQADKWLKLFKGQIRVGLFARTMVQRLGDHAKAWARMPWRAWQRARGPRHPTEDAGQDLSLMCDRGIDVLLLFSEGEPGYDFLRLNHRRDIERLKRKESFSLVRIPHVGHTFTRVAAQRAVLAQATLFLLERFG